MSAGTTAGAKAESRRSSGASVKARERILATVYELFARRGVRAVGVDEIVQSSGVAKATLYRHFPTKDDLVLAWLERRERDWTRGFLEANASARGDTPIEKLLAIFDVFTEWFEREDRFDRCSFVNVLLEMGADHPLGQACVEHLATIRSITRGWAVEAGLRDPEDFSRSWHILMKGSIILATEGDLSAAQRAKEMAKRLIEAHGGVLPGSAATEQHGQRRTTDTASDTAPDTASDTASEVSAQATTSTGSGTSE